MPAIALVFSPDSQFIASSSSDGTTRLSDPISGTTLVSAPGRCVRFNRDGRQLAFHKGVRMGLWDVATGRECRQLRYGRVGNQMPHHSIVSIEDLDFGWNGRLLAAAGNDGVRFWDVAAGEEVGFLPIGRHETAFFDQGGTRLFTYGRTGLRCWPVALKPATLPTTVMVGPPERLDSTTGDDGLRACRDRDGKLLAITDPVNHRVTILNRAQSSRRNVSRDDWNVLNIDMSPDGRWLALDCFPLGMRVWDVAGNRPLSPHPARMAEIGQTVASFSPDGRWLAAGRHNDYRIWRVGHWEEEPLTIQRDNPGFWVGRLAFTRDGRILAIVRTNEEIELFDMATFTSVARLLAPDARHVECLRFSPDGGQLAVATENRVILLWDLRAVCEGLRATGVDWDLPLAQPDAIRPGDRLRVAIFPDTMEAENLKLVAAENCQWNMRATTQRGRAAWSNDRELYGIAEKNGYIELEVDLPQTGRYQLGIYFTKAPDCGLIAVSLDGKTLHTQFDSFRDHIVRSEKIDFGTMTLDEGPHRIRFTSVGKNPDATHYHLAVDCLEWVQVRDGK
jgi:WD40 repeat protein